MARVVLVKQSGLHTIFQIDGGVGLNRVNNKSDVALVQFFLEQTRLQWGGSRAVKMDGVCGKVTIDAILAFQNFANRHYRYNVLKTDSAVDPVRTLPVMDGSRSTLGVLHIFYTRSMPGSAYYPSIHKLSAFKTELVPELFRL